MFVIKRIGMVLFGSGILLVLQEFTVFVTMTTTHTASAVVVAVVDATAEAITPLPASSLSVGTRKRREQQQQQQQQQQQRATTPARSRRSSSSKSSTTSFTVEGVPHLHDAVYEFEVNLNLPHFDFFNFDELNLYEAIPAIQWACEPFLDQHDQDDAAAAITNPTMTTTKNAQHQQQQQHRKNKVFHPTMVQEKTKELCLKLRAGAANANDTGEDTKATATNDEKRMKEEDEEAAVDDMDAVVEEEQEQGIIVAEEEEKQDSTDTNTDTSNNTNDVLSEGILLSSESELDPVIANENNNNNNNNSNRNITDIEPITKSDTNDDDENNPTKNKVLYEYSVYQKNDGHEEDPDGIPTRYLVMQNQRRDLAKLAIEKTVQWRCDEQIDTILSRPHTKFDIAKKVFPHYFCGRDDTDHVILLQRPGLMNIKLASNNQMTGEDLLYHYVYVMEYLWRIIENDVPSATMTSIIDLTGLNISILRKREQMRIGSLFLSTMDAHFPQRSHQTLLINAPKWFGALYKIASPLLRESTKQKIQILSKGPDQDRILQQLLSKCPTQPDDDEDDIGGTTSTTQTQTQQHEDQYENVPAGIMEEELRNFCLARLEEAGETMQPVVPL